MEGILKALGYPQQVVEKFEREGVTPEAMSLMSHEQLDQLGIHGIGRQAILISRCRIFNNGTPERTGNSVQSEVNRLFRPYNTSDSRPNRKRKRMISLTFMCLALPDAKRTPSTFLQKVLKSAGLGEKKITIQANTTAEQLHEHLLTEYPKLRLGGGYEYLRSIGASRILESIPLPRSGGYTASNLKAEAKQARIYLRPIQDELDVFDNDTEGNEGDDDEMSDLDEIMEKCKKCNKLTAQTKLKQHVAECKGPSTQRNANARPELSTPGTCSEASSSNRNANARPELSTPGTCSEASSSNRNANTRPELSTPGTCSEASSSNRYMDDYVDLIEEDDSSDEEIMKTVMEESLRDTEVKSDETALIARMQLKLTEFMKKRSDESITIVIRRKKVLKTALDARRQDNFSFLKRPVINFSGEDAVDLGGPKREFFTLSTQQLTNLGVFEGKPGLLYFSHDISILESGMYRFAGEIVGWSIMHGGPGFPSLHPAVFSLMCGINNPTTKFAVQDVMDIDILMHLESIGNCSTDEEIKEAITKSGDWAASNGCTSIYGLSLVNKDDIVQALLKQHMFYRSKAEIDQFKEGIENVAGLWSIIQGDHQAFCRLLVNKGHPLDFSEVKKLYRINRSSGSQLLEEEEETIFCWEKFLSMCEAGECKIGIKKKGESTVTETVVGLTHVIRFCTGADAIPPTGFEKQIDLNFYTPVAGRKAFPTASTCGLELHLARGISDIEAFVSLMCEAIVNSPGFGKQ